MRGEKLLTFCPCGKSFEDYKSNKRSNFCSLPCYWNARKSDTRYVGYWTGKSRDLSTRLKISQNRKGLTAKEKHPNWKGGISNELHNLRQTFEYKEWRKNVFKRDGWRCVLCSFRSIKRGDIHADHIKRFADFPTLRFELTNGRTLCVPCHMQITHG